MLFNSGSKHQAVRACTVPTRFEPIRRRSFVVIAEPRPGRLVPPGGPDQAPIVLSVRFRTGG
ncbi:hypothetical protein AMJ96_PD00066 (plasmid) [Rhizobium sp. N113]|nr:hypothetical protein AMJ96_PD00066 [Rhizobium sp. N113]ARO27626.1 hypothetical protein TAL182_PE00072 [Rhizobium sp. TAL182]